MDAIRPFHMDDRYDLEIRSGKVANLEGGYGD
jgi:hypothetical protein